MDVREATATTDFVGTGNLALVLSGGGARAAYQVGVLQAIAERAPGLSIPILTGVSAGSINAAYLAGRTCNLPEAIAGLRSKWGEITTDKVYGPPLGLMARSAARWLVRAVTGWRAELPLSRGMFDSDPLREWLGQVIPFEGIDANLESGRLRAVALSASSFATGLTTTFVHGAAEIPMWKRALRVGVRARLTLDHVMASAAIPLIFPAVRLDGAYYGDGSVRQTSPVAPAIHLGARRVLAIASGPLPSTEEPTKTSKYPTAAEAVSLLLDSVFLDTLDADAERLDRMNRMLEVIPPTRQAPGDLKHVDLLVLRPSRDLGSIAEESRGQIPKAMSVLLNAMGSEQERGGEFLSYLLFEPGHTDKLIELGYDDAMAQWETIKKLIGS